MRVLVVLPLLLATATAGAAPRAMIGDVAYDFVDQNGFGWAVVAGTVTVQLTFAGTGGTLRVTGHRTTRDGRLVPGKDPAGPPTLAADKWQGDVDDTYPLHDVAVTGTTIAFKLDPNHDHLAGSCAPAKLAGITRSSLYECTITGFQWHTLAQLPELHHPIILDTNVRAKIRILNSMRGAARPRFGQRTVTEPKPAARR